MAGKKKVEPVDAVETPEVSEEVKEVAVDAVETPETKAETKEVKGNEPDERILKIMALYPQYKKMWITKEGFVHPEGASKHFTKGAKLYENKSYKK